MNASLFKDLQELLKETDFIRKTFEGHDFVTRMSSPLYLWFSTLHIVARYLDAEDMDNAEDEIALLYRRISHLRPSQRVLPPVKQTPQLRAALDRVEWLSSCGWIRSYYDDEAPAEYQGYVKPSTLVFNLLSHTENICSYLLENKPDEAINYMCNLKSPNNSNPRLRRRMIESTMDDLSQELIKRIREVLKPNRLTVSTSFQDENRFEFYVSLRPRVKHYLHHTYKEEDYDTILDSTPSYTINIYLDTDPLEVQLAWEASFDEDVQYFKISDNRSLEDFIHIVQSDVSDSVLDYNWTELTKDLEIEPINMSELLKVLGVKRKALESTQTLTEAAVPYQIDSNGKLTFASKQPNGFDAIEPFDRLRVRAVDLTGVYGKLGELAFNECNRLKSVFIPATVISIGKHAFQGCSSLTSINIPGSVTLIERCTFNECRKLTSINIPDSVTSIGPYAFAGCSSLTSISIPTSVMLIRGCAFEDCTALHTIKYTGTQGQFEDLARNNHAAFWGMPGIPYDATEQKVLETLYTNFNIIFKKPRRRMIENNNNLTEATIKIPADQANGEFAGTSPQSLDTLVKSAAENEKRESDLQKATELQQKANSVITDDKDAEEIVADLFDILAAGQTPIKTKAGMIISALNRLIYRYVNDGDRFYTRNCRGESADQTATYLAKQNSDWEEELIDIAENGYTDDNYENALLGLAQTIISELTQNTELFIPLDNQRSWLDETGGDWDSYAPTYRIILNYSDHLLAYISSDKLSFSDIEDEISQWYLDGETLGDNPDIIIDAEDTYVNIEGLSEGQYEDLEHQESIGVVWETLEDDLRDSLGSPFSIVLDIPEKVVRSVDNLPITTEKAELLTNYIANELSDYVDFEYDSADEDASLADVEITAECHDYDTFQEIQELDWDSVLDTIKNDYPSRRRPLEDDLYED